MWNGFGIGNLHLPVIHEVQKNFELWVLQILLQKDKTFGVRTLQRLFPQWSRTSRLDIPVLCGSLGWVQLWVWWNFEWLLLAAPGQGWWNSKPVEAWRALRSENGAGETILVWPRSVRKVYQEKKKNTTSLLERFSLFLSVRGSQKSFQEKLLQCRKAATLRSIISCWFKVRNEPWLAWKGGNAAFLCSKSWGCLYLSSSGVA